MELLLNSLFTIGGWDEHIDLFGFNTVVSMVTLILATNNVVKTDLGELFRWGN